MKQNDASAAIQQQQAALLADLAAEQGCSTTIGVIAIDPLISAETSREPTTPSACLSPPERSPDRGG